jgi:hypothetical protein
LLASLLLEMMTMTDFVALKICMSGSFEALYTVVGECKDRVAGHEG